MDRGDARFVLKRTSPDADWIIRATRDTGLREGFIAGTGMRLADPLVAPYLGAGSDGPAVAILMPDLSNELIAWERPGHDPVVGPATLDHVLEAVAGLHAMPWADYRPTSPDWGWPWCPLRERLLLLTRPSAARYRVEGLAVGDRFVAGWDAFDRVAPREARALISDLADDPSPLLAALARLPATGIHGDLKLANVALLDDGRVALIDWSMMSLAPVAVELAWLIVSNSASLPIEPDAVLLRYREIADRVARKSLDLGGRWGDRDTGATRLTLPPRGPESTIGDWDVQRDLIWIVGLLMRGWRKGLDAEAGIALGSGVDASDDLGMWCARAVEAAARRLP